MNLSSCCAPETVKCAKEYAFIDCQSQWSAYLYAFLGKVAKVAFPRQITALPELCLTSAKTVLSFCGCSLNLFERRLYSAHKSIANNKAAHSAGECWIYYGWCNLLNCCLRSFVIINQRAAGPKEQFGPLQSYSIASSVISFRKIIWGNLAPLGIAYVWRKSILYCLRSKDYQQHDRWRQNTNQTRNCEKDWEYTYDYVENK